MPPPLRITKTCEACGFRFKRAKPRKLGMCRSCRSAANREAWIEAAAAKERERLRRS